MRLRKMDVTGYLSVKETQTLQTDRNVTILIGANDHGKSNLLSALQCLNDDHPFTHDDINWDLNPEAPIEIKWYFEPSDEEMVELRKLAGPAILPTSSGDSETDATLPTLSGAAVFASSPDYCAIRHDVRFGSKADDRAGSTSNFQFAEPNLTVRAPVGPLYAREMATFFLKMFTRWNPNSSAGEVVGEWNIEAANNRAATRIAKRKLDAAGFRPPDDFAILRDETGKKIWDYVAPRESDLK